MPLYEYKCLKCGKKTEKIESVNGPHLKKCPHCAGKVEMMLSAPAIQFKGSGWYVTDYAGKKSGGGDSGKDDKSSGDSKDASKDSGAKDSGGKDSGGKDKKADKAEKSDKSEKSEKSAKSEKKK